MCCVSSRLCVWLRVMGQICRMLMAMVSVCRGGAMLWRVDGRLRWEMWLPICVSYRMAMLRTLGDRIHIMGHLASGQSILGGVSS